ncbi:MAG: PilZ domain-containing protein [Deltaproteobacteria bacterium]|nr:PilZ domain-containing protein [Deltaproteobacteria bacterium]
MTAQTRRHLRIELTGLRARLHSGGRDFGAVEVGDVSDSGVFVRCETVVLPFRAPIELRFGEMLTLFGEVVRQVDDPTGRWRGFGVELRAPAPSVVEDVRRFARAPAPTKAPASTQTQTHAQTQTQAQAQTQTQTRSADGHGEDAPEVLYGPAGAPVEILLFGVAQADRVGQRLAEVGFGAVACCGVASALRIASDGSASLRAAVLDLDAGAAVRAVHRALQAVPRRLTFVGLTATLPDSDTRRDLMLGGFGQVALKPISDRLLADRLLRALGARAAA